MLDLNSLTTFVIEPWESRFLDLLREVRDMGLHLIIQNSHNYIKGLTNNSPGQNSPIKIRNEFLYFRPISIIKLPNLTWLEVSSLDSIRFLFFFL